MSRHSRIIAWTARMSTQRPALRTPQATVLALWSVGRVRARSWALTAVAAFLARWVRRPEPTVRHQRREWCDEAEATRGDQRPAVAPQACGVPRWEWLISQWQGPQLALARAATTWGTRFTVLALSVLSRGGAMPVAWTSWPANPPHAGRRAWRRRLRARRPALPTRWTVLGLADRGR